MIGTIIIMGSIVGLKSTQKIEQKQVEVSINKFLVDMDKQIENTKNNYGKVLVEDFTLTKSIQKICIIDLKTSNNNISAIESHPLINDSVGAGVLKNLFLIKEDDDIYSFYNPFVRLNDNKANCYDIPQSEIKFRFTGGGNSTIIEQQLN